MQLDLVSQRKPNLASQASTDNQFEQKLARILEKLGFDKDKAPEFWLLLIPTFNEYLTSKVAEVLSVDEILAINMEAASRQYDDIKLGSMYALAFEDETGKEFDSLFESFLQELDSVVDEAVRTAKDMETLAKQDEEKAAEYIQKLMTRG